MKHYIFATLAASLLILAGLVSSVSAQTYDQFVQLPLSLSYGQSLTIVSQNGASYTVTCEAAICPAGDTFAVDGTMPSYGLTYGSYVSVSPVVSYSSVYTGYSSPCTAGEYQTVYGCTAASYAPYSAIGYSVPQYIPEPYAVPVPSYGDHGFGNHGHDGGHDHGTPDTGHHDPHGH